MWPWYRRATYQAVGLASVGAGIAWATSEPSGLLLTLVAFLSVGRRSVRLAAAGFFAVTLGCVLLGSAAGWLVGAPTGPLAFLATALGLSLIPLRFEEAEQGLTARQARLIVESMPGMGWASDNTGKLVFLNKSVFDYVGMPPPDLSRDGYDWLPLIPPSERDAVVATWRRSLETGQPYDIEHRIRRFDGVYRWFRAVAYPARDASGQIWGWHGTTIDIDSQKQAELALGASERQFRQLVDTVPTLIWCLTADGEPSYFNKQLVDYCGLDVGDADQSDRSRLAAIIGAIIHPDDAAAVDTVLAAALATGRTFSLKYRVRRADGVYRWIAGRAEPMRDREGQIQQWYGLCFDIEDEVRAQEALRERERQLKLIIDTVPGLIWSVTPEGEPSYYNKRLTDWGGVDLPDFDPSGSSLLTAAIEIIIHPEDRPAVEAALRHCFATGQSWNMRYRQRRADGVYRWIEGRAEPLHDANGRIAQWYGLSLDIDDQLSAETALRQSEEQLRRLVDTVPALIWKLTPEGEPSYYNKRLVDWFGIDVDGVDTPGSTRIAATIGAVVHPDDVDGVTQALDHSLATGEPYARRYRLRLNTGEYRWIEARCEPLRDESGAIVQWFGVNLDIDDEMRAEASLRQSERQLRQLVDTVPSLIWCLDQKGEPSYYNRRLVEWLGFGVDELDRLAPGRLDAAIGSIVHPDYRAAVAEALAWSLSTGDAFVMKYPQRTADGSFRWTEGRLEALRDEDGAIVHWYGVLLDIEDEVRVQDALRLAHDKLARASQAASLAELSASIAHEVNQPLAAIVANAHACQRWLTAVPPNPDRARTTAERIIRDANSAADVISRIRALFQQTVKARSPTDVNQVILEVRTLMADELSALDIGCAFDLDDDLPPAFIDRVQIQQVVLNLLRNGIDAMETVRDRDRSVRIVTRREGGDMIRVEVQDRGIGIIDPDRVFDAFFTTKRDGMGMGLAICRSIIDSHGGRIWATDNPPQGTTLAFTVPLPREET